MEMQIQDLIDSIRKDGLEKAERESEQVISEAKAKAEGIVKEAEEKAAKLISDAKKRISLEEETSKAALEQASRDALLTFRKKMVEEINLILKSKVSQALDAKTLTELVKIVVEKECDDASTVVVPEKLEEEVSKGLAKELADKVSKGLQVKGGKQFGTGFVVMEKDGEGYVDLSDDALVSLLMPYLSESLKKLFH